MTFEAIAQEIHHLSIEERKRLIALLLDSFTEPSPDEEEAVDIMEFAGVGRHLFDGTDAQQMVNEMRREWDERA